MLNLRRCTSEYCPRLTAGRSWFDPGLKLNSLFSSEPWVNLGVNVSVNGCRWYIGELCDPLTLDSPPLKTTMWSFMNRCSLVLVCVLHPGSTDVLWRNTSSLLLFSSHGRHSSGFFLRKQSYWWRKHMHPLLSSRPPTHTHTHTHSDTAFVWTLHNSNVFSHLNLYSPGNLQNVPTAVFSKTCPHKYRNTRYIHTHTQAYKHRNRHCCTHSHTKMKYECYYN